MTFFVTLGLLGEMDKSLLPGVDIRPLDSKSRKFYDIPSDAFGVIVTKSVGEQNNFKEGVLIVEINGAPIRNLDDVRNNLQKGFNRFYVWYAGKYRFVSYRIP